jgi:diguanylate cyclase (GGDEF)-like protein
MLRVYSCIVQEHDLRLVVIAGVICLLASCIALTAFDQARRDETRTVVWATLSAVVAGLGIWATHFIAMLAYEPRIPVGYELSTTLLSVAAAVGVTGIGWWVALRRHPAFAWLGGAIVGAGVGTMHYVGMAAVELAGVMVWDRTLVIVSVVVGVGLATAAVGTARLKVRKVARFAPIVLTAAICGLHFTAMAAVSIYPSNAVPVPAQAVDGAFLVIAVTAAISLILFAGFGVIAFERKLARVHLEQAEHRAALADEILRGAAERDALTLRLQREVELNSAALENMVHGLSVYDEGRRLVTFNRQYAELYGIPADLLVAGTPYSEIRDSLIAGGVLAQRPEDYDRMVESAREAGGQFEVELLDGRIIEVRLRPMPSGGWLGTHEDVTEARRSVGEIAFLASHDTLTGLPNRVTFAERLGEALAGAQEPGLAVLTIDLDRFKEVNDTLGHPCGDRILKDAADRLRRLAAEGDTVTRLGGDEFAMIRLGEADPENLARLAERIIEALDSPFEFEGHTVVIGASIGISLAPRDSQVGEELLKMSDLALYRAKNETRGTYRFYESGMDALLRERRELEADLRVAIREGQFEVHYQPLLDLSRGTIGCFEALVRWRHPVRGLVAPLDFITIAEDTGLIIPIGEWVLRQACRDAAGWPEDVRVAVNLSPAQFKRGDLLAVTMSALAAANLAPERLELEITESVLLHDEAWVRSLLDRLKALGLRIALDDFGTGYSSLSYLRSFPFTKIKIDRSFVSDLVGTTDALAIVQATIQLSEKLGLETTAEGVESVEQLDILASEGCTQAQGYHISRPIPAAQVEELLETYAPSHERRTASAS